MLFPRLGTLTERTLAHGLLHVDYPSPVPLGPTDGPAQQVFAR